MNLPCSGLGDRLFVETVVFTVEWCHFFVCCLCSVTPFTITFVFFMLLTADSLCKYIQRCHNIYCLSLLLFYYFEHKTLTSCSVFITRTNCMKSSSVLILMQSSSPTFSTPSTVTVSIFSCKVIKKKKF